MSDQNDGSRDDEQRDSEATERQAATPDPYTNIVEAYLASGIISRSIHEFGGTEYIRGPEANDEQWAHALKALLLAMTGTGLGRGLISVRLVEPHSETGEGSVRMMRTKWPEDDEGSAVDGDDNAGDSPLDTAVGKMAAKMQGAKLVAMLNPDERARVTVSESVVVTERVPGVPHGSKARHEEGIPTGHWPDTLETLEPASERSSRSGFGEDAGVDILPGDHRDYSDEQVEPFPEFTREPVPHEEQTRRGMLIGLAIGFVALTFIQLGLALALSEDDWARVGPTLTGASTLISAGIGYALGHYFSGKK